MYVIWAMAEGRRLRIGVTNARVHIPFPAKAITTVEPCDVHLMKQWLKKRAKKGWSLEELRRACDVGVEVTQ